MLLQKHKYTLHEIVIAKVPLKTVPFSGDFQNKEVIIVTLDHNDKGEPIYGGVITRGEKAGKIKHFDEIDIVNH